MKAMILAAGKGTRVRPITHVLPKPMIPLIRKPVMEFLAAEFSRKTLAEWNAYLAKLDVCYGCVNTLPEAFDHPNLVSRGMIRFDAQNRRHVGPPIRFRDEPAQPVLHEPGLGEHTARVLNHSGSKSE